MLLLSVTFYGFKTLDLAWSHMLTLVIELWTRIAYTIGFFNETSVKITYLHDPPILAFIRNVNAHLLSQVVALSWPSLLTSSYTYSVVHLCCVGLLILSPNPSGWRDVPYALPLVQQCKKDKHTTTCKSHGLKFSTLGSLSPTADELLP